MNTYTSQKVYLIPKIALNHSAEKERFEKSVGSEKIDTDE